MDNETVICEICHQEATANDTIKLLNGRIHPLCWPDALSYTVRWSSSLIYKQGIDYTQYYNPSYLIVTGSFPPNFLDDSHTPYTILLLENAIGEINTQKHDYHFVSMSPNITFKNINRYGEDIYYTNFSTGHLTVENCSLYSFTVEARAPIDIIVKDSTITTVNVKTHGDAIINTTLDKLKTNTLSIHNVDMLQTTECIVNDMLIISKNWIDNESVITTLDDDNSIVKVALDRTDIHSGVLNAAEGTIRDSKLTLIKNDNVVITAQIGIRFHIPSICGICKEYITNNDIIIQGKKVHTSCWRRDGSRTSNNKYKGDDDSFPTFSIELELNGTERDYEYTSLLYDLLENGFIRCSDGTVTDELKSPIFKNMQAFLELKNLFIRAIPYITNRCRTHVHVGASSTLKDMIYYNHHMFFDGLGQWFHTHSNTVHSFFGCTSSSLCSYTFTGDRFCWLNSQTPYPTIEYRLSCATSYEQFERLIKFFREFTMFLENRLQSLPQDGARWPRTKQRAGNDITQYVTTYIQQFFNVEESENQTQERQITGAFLPYPNSSTWRCGDPDCESCYPHANEDDDIFDDDDMYGN